MTNALLAPWTTPFGIAPFDAIGTRTSLPRSRPRWRRRGRRWRRSPRTRRRPSFANTVEALELADERLGRVLSVFYTLAGADTNEARNALQREFSPKLAAYGSEVSMNPALFARIEALWEGAKVSG
jgi:peptidyl-dipeptidase Dcp